MSEITINIKSSQDKKYSLTVPLSLTVREFKDRVAAISEIEVERQRLIYSGRVLKDPDTLESYKIADGNTVHLVKGAATSSTSNQPAAAAQVPQSVSAGINPSNPLNAFTSSQYAGHQIPLPPPSLFGPDGGMTFPSTAPGSSSDPSSLQQMMSDPATQAAMHAMLQDPAMLDMILERSGLRNVPGAREMMRSEGFRRAMLDPGVLGRVGEMGGMMGGQQGSFPAPGGQQQGQQGQQQGVGAGQQPNPFAGIFGPGSIFGAGAAGAGAPGAAGAGAQANPLAGLMSMFGGPAAGAGTGAGAGTNPFADPALLEMLMGGMGGAGGMGMNNPSTEAETDTRPLEERYQTQLGQLNDMGFLDFERNIAALRRSGGNVQGAIEVLLSGGV
ncbi:hypothetical protein SAICODRAFT_7230 [Saitoella complicata NRRL Y-17804]|uniref:Ubiquitin-like domain-containing protein n=1 Tax=Saitoella complicata (strain BCRC 22490 / CBS 7301 / JCM 7358 / NBRC 10748 / NRRL Y-17804) TaxID=698492 RepID=A0A0E9NNS6_SAICN|nr:uncharacterized protein SAICODRAFT_7230 [Saitoella complicata NRRL Y-17804]ODQ53527.1 hypothetical protein SAICODRAFT_7230 [Saitoella complicata NRRL Y-17804]GAO51075.1 hypothetical protein G7K_5187-t1 [Saitoella complicata NRRL Y-17804]